MFRTAAKPFSFLRRSVSLVRDFGRDERGAVAIEYGVIVLLMAIAIVATLLSIGETLRDGYFAEASAGLQQAASTGN
ncbi:Flp family type IVb pilin [Roseibium aestuarii]|uniref:Flp family type IVb pilin n=1 Tax=Roseibium aestuarii TaxID=2600299 RepID=A0ABW4JW48_9HYPH|nr:Flp family type IVb pilin [Roseibium aestuarii]